MQLRNVTAAIAVATLMSISTLSAAAEVNMLTWGGGVDRAWSESFIDIFTDKTGIKASAKGVLSPATEVHVEKGSPSFNTAIVTMFQALELSQSGLLETFDVDQFPALSKVPANTILKDDNDKLIGIPVYYMYYGIAINKDEASPSDFSSWKNLTDPKWKNKLSITRPAYSVFYDLTIMAYANGGDETNYEPGLDLMEGLIDNSIATYSSMAQFNQLIQRGEVAAAPYYSARIWQMQEEGADNVDLVIPDEGALMLPFVVVVPKGAADKDAYMKFLDFVTEPEGQEKMFDVSGYVPLNPDAQISEEGVEKIGGSLEQLLDKLVIADWNVIGDPDNREERLEKVEILMAK